jgi:hypothetical protein
MSAKCQQQTNALQQKSSSPRHIETSKEYVRFALVESDLVAGSWIEAKNKPYFMRTMKPIGGFVDLMKLSVD